MLPLTSTQIHTRPASALVAAIRDRHGFTQTQCAGAVGVDPRSWQGYEAKDGAMPMQVWWLFLLRVQEIRFKDLPHIPGRQRVAASV